MYAVRQAVWSAFVAIRQRPDGRTSLLGGSVAGAAGFSGGILNGSSSTGSLAALSDDPLGDATLSAGVRATSETARDAVLDVPTATLFFTGVGFG
jgi:hypothetical protein